MYGAVGDDKSGEDLLSGLADCGVGVDNVKVLSGSDTGQAYITVSDAGENAIVIIAGANREVAYRETGDDEARTASVRLAQLEVPVDAIRSFFSSSPDSSGATRILNAAPALPEAKELFSLSDIIVINETELEVFAQAQVDEDSTREALVSAARSLISREGQRVVVTLGAKGCLMVGSGEELAIPGHRAHVVDTTGAGDCFCGVLAAAVANGESLEQALHFANAAASLAVGKKGAGPSMPTLAEIREKATSQSAQR